MHVYVELEPMGYDLAPLHRGYVRAFCCGVLSVGLLVVFGGTVTGSLSSQPNSIESSMQEAQMAGKHVDNLAAFLTSMGKSLQRTDDSPRLRSGGDYVQRRGIPYRSSTNVQGGVRRQAAASTWQLGLEDGLQIKKQSSLGAAVSSLFQPFSTAVSRFQNVPDTIRNSRSFQGVSVVDGESQPASFQGVSVVDGDVAAQRLRIVNFNVLAPSCRICTPLNTVSWRDRHEAICNTILTLAPDIVCLQEFDFASKTSGFFALYEAKLGHLFEFHLKQRTGFKNEGLAVLVRREAFVNTEVKKFDLQPWFCHRVAILTRMTHKVSRKQIVLINTHLTVAHASNDYDIPMCRPMQMDQVLTHLAGEVRGDSLTFVCADMNSDHMETEDSGRYTAAEVSRPVTLAFETGLTSALHAAHPGRRPISHACSYAQSGCADYIFFKPSQDMSLQGAFLYPETLPLDTPWDEGAGWDRNSSSILPSTLSDHRPLVADFQLALPVTAEASSSSGAAGEVGMLAGVSPSKAGPPLIKPNAVAAP